MSYVAAFRTYTWNNDVQTLGERFFRACPSARKVILADETRGCLNIDGYEVISHTSDTASLGLPEYPKGSSLWYNVDYGIYFLRKALPQFDYYLLSESDLAVNVELESMILAAKDRNIDIITHDVRRSTEDWYWHKNGSEVFKDPWRALLFFMVLSGRAADALLSARQELASKFENGTLSTWPFCEPFLPTVLKEKGMNFAEVGEFAKTENLRFRPRIALDDPRANEPGSLAHSVMGVPEYLKATFKEHDPREWFKLKSPLRIALGRYALHEYANQLYEAFLKKVDYAGLHEFIAQAKYLGVEFTQMDDIAYCKPALVSSTSSWSHSSDRSIEAAGANGTVIYEDYGFHTKKEIDPWWMVDLIYEFVIDKVIVINRSAYPERFCAFTIESSVDSSVWVPRFTKLDAKLILGNEPFEIEFRDPFVAKFVKVRLLGNEVFHLKRVQIFGREIPRVSSIQHATS